MPEHLIKLNNELEPYRTGKEIKGKKVRYLSKEGEFRYLRDKRIFGPKNKLRENRAKDFQEHQINMSELSRLKAKKEFAQEKQLESWDTIAQEF